MIKLSTRKGFSLIELLVVIAIIGLLSAFLFGQFGGARERARDAQRKADLRKIQTALEAFYQDNGEYPTQGVAAEPTVLDVLVPDYIAEIPREPNDDGTYYHRYNYDNGGICPFTNGTQTYKLWAWLENDDDAQRTGDCGEHFGTPHSEIDAGDTRFVFMVRSP